MVFSATTKITTPPTLTTFIITQSPRRSNLSVEKIC
ncbi:hypothetical protein OROGR_010546 [Orobanche gracilis]